MEQVNCNYCQANDTSFVNEGADLQLNRPGLYRLVRCNQCGLIYQNPKLTREELPTHYPDSYQRYQTDLDTPPSKLVQADRRRGMHKLCAKVEKYHPAKGHVLDIGCATGEFLDAMRERGWQTSGVEISQFATTYARNVLNLDVFTGTLEEARFPDAQFDVVTMWDVIEHVVDPTQTIAEIKRILKPNGVFVALTPNPNSLAAKLFGDSWAGWDRPRHLHIFPPPVMKEYLFDAGFTTVHMESFSGRLKVSLLSLGYRLNQWGVDPARSGPWLDALYNYPLRALTLPIYLVAERFNQTTGITYFAQATA